MHDKTSLDLLSDACVNSFKELWVKIDPTVLLNLVVNLGHVTTDVGHQLKNEYDYQQSLS